MEDKLRPWVATTRESAQKTFHSKEMTPVNKAKLLRLRHSHSKTKRTLDAAGIEEFYCSYVQHFIFLDSSICRHASISIRVLHLIINFTSSSSLSSLTFIWAQTFYTWRNLQIVVLLGMQEMPWCHIIAIACYLLHDVQ